MSDRIDIFGVEPAIIVDTQATRVVRVGPDLVNHPAHYTKGKIEVIEILESIVESMDLTPTECGLTWSVVKYMARWKNKGGKEDLKKAEWYLKRLIEVAK